MSETPPRYRPLLLLGRGGMGSVEAVAEELPDGGARVVALKRILRTTGDDTARVEMFLREARLTTLIEHPNVIRSLAYGETAGELFLAMEYVAGEPLSRVLTAAADRGEKVPASVIAYILAEACEGLHAAHELRGDDGEPLGVIHRDVSPQNVMIGYDGEVKLLDFGVAKIDFLDCATRTKTGEVKGKTAYMSPEQAMGDPLDRRSDLYSMGAVLFEGVTGERMWGSGTDLDVLRKLALEDPPRLSAKVPDVAPALEAIFARAVSRERAKRPETAQNLARELRAVAGVADAAAVRATMTRLFDGERERRAKAIAAALAGETSDTDLPAEGSVGRIRMGRSGPGESGPVFITQSGGPAANPARPATGKLVSSAVALLAVTFGAYALLHRDPRGADGPRASSGERATESAGATARGETSGPPANPAPTTSATNAAANETRPPAPASSGVAGHVAAVPGVRHLSPHRVGPPLHVVPLAPAAPGMGSATSPAPGTPPPATRPPESSDVDPTPF